MPKEEQDLIQSIMEKAQWLSGDQRAKYLTGVHDGLAAAMEIALSFNLNLAENKDVKSFFEWLVNEK
jgi:hypothetical protein